MGVGITVGGYTSNSQLFGFAESTPSERESMSILNVDPILSGHCDRLSSPVL